MDGELLSDAFVELADTLVADFDVIDFLHTLTERSVQLLDASAAGVLLADPRGELRLVAASTEAARVLELFQLQNDQGPCLDCFRSAQPVAAPDLTTAGQRWPQFAAAAAQAGFARRAGPADAAAQPGHRRAEPVPGHCRQPEPRGRAGRPGAGRRGDHRPAARAQPRRGETLSEQLQGALNSRVVIEQAKGKLAERLGLDMDQAFTVLRSYARDQNLRLSGLAQAFIDGSPADFPGLTAPVGRSPGR